MTPGHYGCYVFHTRPQEHLQNMFGINFIAEMGDTLTGAKIFWEVFFSIEFFVFFRCSMCFPSSFWYLLVFGYMFPSNVSVRETTGKDAAELAASWGTKQRRTKHWTKSNSHSAIRVCLVVSAWAGPQKRSRWKSKSRKVETCVWRVLGVERPKVSVWIRKNAKSR